MRLHIAFSTCPNDTFMFDALVHHRIDTFGYEFSPVLEDIENLNLYAASGEPDLCKISYAFYPFISKNYQLLSAGSALGYGNGPLLVSRLKIYPDEVTDLCVAIPGERTTANTLLSIFYPGIKQKKTGVFSDIEEMVLSGEADAGVLIHETRFTYQKKGLKLISDLGTLWEGRTKLPIPLGAIAVKRDLPESEKQKLNTIMRESVAFAMQNPRVSESFIRKHAQISEESVYQKHIALYVNGFSIDLSSVGKEAVSTLFTLGEKAGLLPGCPEPIFV